MPVSAELDDAVRQLFAAKNFVQVGTIRKDGTPHIVPVWGDVDGDTVVLNTAKGRVWPNNLERDNRITVAVQNSENPYEFAEVRGTAELSADGADAHIDSLAKKYMDLDEYPLRQEGEVRLIVRITPSKVFHMKAG